MIEDREYPLTEAERRAFAELPRETDVSADEEERTVRALRASGLLRGRRSRRGPARHVLRLAAGLVLFIAGALAGSLYPGEGGAGAADPVSRVERTGAAFVAAISGAAAADLPRTSTDSAAQAALGSLRAAAGTLPLLGVQTPAVLDLQAALAGYGGEWTVNRETVIWF